MAKQVSVYTPPQLTSIMIVLLLFLIFFFLFFKSLLSFLWTCLTMLSEDIPHSFEEQLMHLLETIAKLKLLGLFYIPHNRKSLVVNHLLSSRWTISTWTLIFLCFMFYVLLLFLKKRGGGGRKSLCSTICLLDLLRIRAQRSRELSDRALLISVFFPSLFQ